MANKSDIANVIAGMKALFPNYAPDPARTPEMFMQILGDLDSDTLQAATLSLCSDGRAFALAAGEIRAEAIRLHALAAGIPSAHAAYSEVVSMPADMVEKKFVETVEFTGIEKRRMEFSHPLVERVARLMGWPASFPTDKAGVDRAQFVKAYEAELERITDDSGRLRIVTDYIDHKRAALAGGAPALMSSIAKRLEVKDGL